MPRTNITEFSNVASENTDINSVNIAENCPASGINNALRELMKALKDVDTGSQALTALSVTGALSCGAFTSNGIDDNADATAITIDNSERVGVGTTTPSVPLHVNGGTDNIVAKFESSDADALIEFTDNATSDTILLGADTDDLLFRCDPGNIIFKTNNNTESMRIDSSGDLMVGSTTTAPHTLSSGGAFTVRGSLNLLSIARADNEAMILNRTSSNGAILQFRKDGSTIGVIGSGTGRFSLNGTNGSTGSGIQFDINAWLPKSHSSVLADNDIDLGSGSFRFDDVFATNGTIQTSDKNEKQDIEELSDAEKRVAVVAKGLMRKFRWKDAVAEKGDKARTHFGIIAQDLENAFKAEGLDASKYAMFCSDTWWEKEISVDAVEADEEKGIEAKDAYTYMDTKEEATEGYTEKTRLGVRYSELLAFIILAI